MKITDYSGIAVSIYFKSTIALLALLAWLSARTRDAFLRGELSARHGAGAGGAR